MDRAIRLLLLFVPVAAAYAIPVGAEEWADRWARGEALYGARCGQEGPPIGGRDYRECVTRLLNSAEATEQRRVDSDSLEGRLTRAYGERCQLAGYTPGTGAFGQCLLAYADRDEQARRAVAAQLLLNQFAQQQAQANRPVPNPFANLRFAPPPPAAVNCTSIIGNQIVTTTCR